MARIYSNKMPRVVLWDGDLPEDSCGLDIEATDAAIAELQDTIFGEITDGLTDGEIDENRTEINDRVFTKIWDDRRLDACYCWMPYKTIDDLDIGTVANDEDENFAIVKLDECGKKFYAALQSPSDSEIESAIPVADMDEDYLM